MLFSTATVPVNPGGERKLTREQVRAGLVLKARDARLFLPPGACTKCEGIAEGWDFIVRDAVIMNDEITEIVTFAPQQKVSFHQVKSPREGVIVNKILEDDAGELQLRFYAYLGLPCSRRAAKRSGRHKPCWTVKTGATRPPCFPSWR